MRMFPDPSCRETIESLLAPLLADDDACYPEAGVGFLRTFIYPCDYELPADRARILGSVSDTDVVYAKLLWGEIGYTLDQTGLTHDEIVKESAAQLGHFPPTGDRWKKHVNQLWWRGSWSDEAQEPGIEFPEDETPLEHILLDGAGAWAVVLSPDDYGYLVSDEQTSRKILAAWRTTPAQELAKYETNWLVLGEEERLAMEHARAGMWE
jgi:hypothetical protein